MTLPNVWFPERLNRNQSVANVPTFAIIRRLDQLTMNLARHAHGQTVVQGGLDLKGEDDPDVEMSAEPGMRAGDNPPKNDKALFILSTFHLPAAHSRTLCTCLP